MDCQKENSIAIRHLEADYLLALKDNHRRFEEFLKLDDEQ